MNSNQFSKENPFSVPDGYFETFQHRILSRIREEEKSASRKNGTIRLNPYKAIIAAAACVAIIFAASMAYRMHSAQQPAVARYGLDENSFCEWVYTAEGASLLAESIDVNRQENFTQEKPDPEEQGQEIIRFLERDNITVAAIISSIDDNDLYE
jgi:hypothetical protein